MYSKQQFTPGKSSNSSRVINYVAQLNASYLNSPNSKREQLNCSCITEKYNKNVLNSLNNSNISNKQRISQIINSSKRGNVTFVKNESLANNIFPSPPLNKF